MYAEMSDEQLLNYARLQSGEFSAEAMELIRSELTSRGYPTEDLQAEPRAERIRTPAYAGDVSGKENMVAVAEFKDSFLLQQVKQVLEQEGITSITPQMLDSVIMGDLSFAPLDSPVTLLVHRQNEQRAREIIDTFPPPEEMSEEEPEK